MQLACAHCGQVLDIPGKRLSFCPFCGKSFSDSEARPGSTAAFDHEAATRAPGAADAGDESDPAEVGGYRLVRLLGEGGMGKVYEAEDAATGRRVALKLIAAQYAGSAEAVERFRREGRLASTLSYPRCVFVLAADEEAGRPYIVMELMPGETLHDLVRKRGPLPVEEALPKILDVIEGLKEAHRLGVVHRDVKPPNCFLEPDGRVKVGDFGLAKSLIDGAHLTKTGSFLGTPLFAAPEQIKGEPTGPQADVYSVAATLYYLLTGRAPFQGGDPAATLARIVCDPPPPLRSVRPDLPEALDRVVLRGLERDRDRRWRDLDEFEAALRPLLPGKLSIVGLGLRFGAFAIDYLLIWISTRVLVLVVSWLPALPSPSGDSQVSYLIVTFLLSWLAYYSVSEGIWASSPGKKFLGLGVARAEGAGSLGVVRVLARTGVFFVLWNLNWITQLALFTTGAIKLLDQLAPGWMNPVWFYALINFALAAAGTLLLVSTMRSRNGYRGLHEWASGTRVVRLPEADKPHTLGTDKELPVLHQAGLPDRVGPYNVLGAVRSDGPERVLLGEDPGLGRKVIIWMRPSATGTSVADGRRGLSRATRPRWLSGGRHGDQLWDAFLAPAGQPLPDVVSAGGRLSWAEARYLLAQLAEELAAAEQDATLPAALTAGQVWVQSDGRLQLLDVPVAAGPPPAADALTFLRDVSFLALEGEPRRADDKAAGVRAPLPQHAALLLGRLSGWGEPYRGVRPFSADLGATADKPSAVGRGRRFAHIVVQFLFLYFGSLLGVLAASLALLNGREPDPPFLVRFALAWLAAIVSWAFLTRGGLSLRLLGLSLIRADGRPTGRLQCAWRALLAWAPLTGLLACRLWLDWDPAVWAALALLPLYLVLALWRPDRAPQDRLAGTYLVPR
jgi:serine/threonine protein kinase